MSPRDRADLHLIAGVILVSILLGGAYGALVSPTAMAGAPRGALAGLLISGTLTSLEMLYSRRPRGQWLARQPFAVFVLVKAVIFSLIIVVLMQVPDLVFDGRLTLPDTGELLSGLAFSLAISVSVILFIEVDRLLGSGVLIRLILGRYHKPRIEERVFLFADVIGSTALAERLGDLRFHGFLDRVFFDLVDPIVTHGGEIYRYVGDEVILSWRRDEGLRDGRCLACALAIRETLEQLSARYLEAFGTAPRVRIVLHQGPVVTGEMGDIKREIAFLGDTVNTAARIEAVAKAQGRDLVLSAALMAALETPPGFHAVPLEPTLLRGKEQEVPLVALEPE